MSRSKPSQRPLIGTTEGKPDMSAAATLLSAREPGLASSSDKRQPARASQELSDRVTLLRAASELLLDRRVGNRRSAAGQRTGGMANRGHSANPHAPPLPFED